MKSSLPWSLSTSTKSTFIEGIAGEPGSIRLSSNQALVLQPKYFLMQMARPQCDTPLVFNVWLDSCIAVPHAGEWKERLDFFLTRRASLVGTQLSEVILTIRMLPVWSNVSQVEKSSTEVTWTCTYEPVGDAPAPEHMKEGVVKVLKTLEQAVKSRQTFDPHTNYWCIPGMLYGRLSTTWTTSCPSTCLMSLNLLQTSP